MKTLLNILWLLCGGALNALHWYLVGVLMAVSVVGLPWARACFTLGNFTLWPFGRQMVDRRLLNGQSDLGTGCLGTGVCCHDHWHPICHSAFQARAGVFDADWTKRG
jgi:uncharacterized membrane protein YccF (DUF307 family)